MRRPLKLIAVVLNVAVCVAGITAASAQEPALGSIAGVVWHDTNVDGVRQADEPGLQIPLSINKHGEQPLVVRSGADGSFEFTDLKAGTYLIETQPSGQAFIATYPAKVIHGPITLSVSVAEGAMTTANLGLVTNFAGSFVTAWIDGSQPSKPVVAGFVDGVKCAFTPKLPLLPTDTGPGFTQVYFLPEGLVPGCGVPGTRVSFTINGRPANETVPYPERPAPRLSGSIPRPPVTLDEVPPRILSNLTAGAPFAQYGGQRPLSLDIRGGFFDPQGEVHAQINGVECGIPQFSFGGYNLSVVSVQLKPGCATEGAIVQILIGNVLMAETQWTPGFHSLDLKLEPGAISPRGLSTVRPPDTGDGGLVR